MSDPRIRLLVAAWALVAGCAQSAQVRYEEGLERAPASAQHAVQSERLSELMRGLARLRAERLPRNMDVRVEKQRRAARIAKIALDMAEAADSIPAAAADADLDAAERAELFRLAGELKQQAQGLAAAAPRLSSEEMRARTEAIDATCNRCHQQFRIPRGSRAVD